MIHSLYIYGKKILLLYTFKQVLGSALQKYLNEDERSALLDQLMLIKNANLDLVNTVISSIISNDDDVILVLGALARNNSFTIQKLVVDEIVARLNVELSSSNNEAVTTLIYALGNSGSKLAISPLLSTLQYDDIDIQISVIRSLEFHLDQPIAQQAIITLLHSTDEDKILEEILKILIDAFENKILTNPSEEMINAIINSAIQLENPNLYELVAKYLHLLKTEGIDFYLDLLKQQPNYGDLQHDHIGDTDNNDSRVKRGTDWDENNSDYNIVASYTDRRSDVTKYPIHLAYIWGKIFGVEKLNMKVGAGAFGGMTVTSPNVSFKLYAKIAANLNAFDQTFDIIDWENSRYTSGSQLLQKLYFKKGTSVFKNTVARFEPSCTKKTSKLDGTEQIFNKDMRLYVYIGYIYIDISGTVSYDINMGWCACLSFPPPAAKANADLTAAFTLRVKGNAHTLVLVRM